MTTHADQERRNALYRACGRADRETAGPRQIARDDAPRQFDGKVHRDDSSAALMQPVGPVAERGRLRGALEIDARIRNRDIEHRIAYYRSLEE